MPAIVTNVGTTKTCELGMSPSTIQEHLNTQDNAGGFGGTHFARPREWAPMMATVSLSVNPNVDAM